MEQLSTGEEEEVIAESYDDDSKTSSTARKQTSNAAGAPGCPNKWNPFHTCVEFCYDHWREGTPENRLPMEYNRRRLRMLKKYPLPTGWKEVRRASFHFAAWSLSFSKLFKTRSSSSIVRSLRFSKNTAKSCPTYWKICFPLSHTWDSFYFDCDEQCYRTAPLIPINVERVSCIIIN